MQRFIVLAALAACALACGAPDQVQISEDGFRSIETDGFDATITAEDDPNVEKIFMPNSYGHENSFTKCSNPFNGDCMVPDTRSIVISAHRFTCSETAFKNAVRDAALYMAAVANAEGWNVQTQMLETNATGSSHWIIKCANNGPPGQAGVTSISESIGFLWDCHDTSRGHLCQYKRATSVINENIIKAMAPWGTATAAQRANISANIAKHEAGHMFGFGHPAANGTTLMNNGGGSTLDSFWTSTKVFTQDERDQLDCYNETSGTGSNC